MNRRTYLNSLMEREAFYLPGKFDAALSGYAVHSQQQSGVPVYESSGLRYILRKDGMSPSQVYKSLRELRTRLCQPGEIRGMILQRPEKKELWTAIIESQLPVWDQLNRGVIGIGYSGWDHRGVVYDATKCVGILSDITLGNPDPRMLTVDCSLYMKSHIIPVKFIECSPWYATFA